jgi:two-component system chemotaxis sensor kinase CheA
MDDETREIVSSFVAESREAIDEVEPLLIEMSASGEAPNADVIARVFRLFHSMKGSASYLQFGSIERITHRAETVLVDLRTGTAAPTPALVEALCQVLDAVRARLAQVMETGIDEDESGELERLGFSLEEISRRSVPSGVESVTPVPTAARASVATPIVLSAVTVATPVSESPSAVVVLPLVAEEAVAAPEAHAVAAPSEARHADESTTDGVSLADLVEPFIIEGRDLLDACEQALLSLETDGEASGPVATAFRALHSFKGNCGFLGYVEIERLAHAAETLLEAVKEGEVPRSPDVIGALLTSVDALRTAVSRLPGDSSFPEGAIRAAALVQVESDARGVMGQTRIGRILIERGDINASDLVEALDADRAPVGTVLAERGLVTPARLDAALGEQAQRRGVTARAETRQVEKPQTSLRVDVGKLDALMDLVGELIIAETAVIHAPSSHGAVSSQELPKALAQLDRITRSLQDVAMSLRMVPIDATFRKMIRVVRDVANKQGKQVALRVEGEETEVDKTVAEIIGDPLVHLLRNAVDHGIEMPEVRAARGKPVEGTLKLTASHVGGEIWVRIQDDGGGISRTRVLEKAVERGLVTAAAAPSLSDADVFAFIFEAGFSTAAAVTDISGRGVGMDVVKRQIERVKGRIDIASVPEQGTTITLRIPLTLAIIEGMVVRVGDTSFTIPLLCIRESVVPRSKDVTHLADGEEIVRIRGQLLSVLRMHRFYGIEPLHERLEDGILVVVEDGGQAVCLFVDELIGQRQTVIKGLSGFLGDPRSLSGCTVLGDGRISLILDVAGLIGAVPRAA